MYYYHHNEAFRPPGLPDHLLLCCDTPPKISIMAIYWIVDGNLLVMFFSTPLVSK